MGLILIGGRPLAAHERADVRVERPRQREQRGHGLLRGPARRVVLLVTSPT